MKVIAGLVLLGSMFVSNYAYGRCAGWYNEQTNQNVYKCHSDVCDPLMGKDRYTEYKTGCTVWCCPGGPGQFDISSCDQEVGVWLPYEDANGNAICCPNSYPEIYSWIQCQLP